MGKVRWTKVRGRLIAWTFFFLASSVICLHGVAEINARIPVQPSYYCLVADGEVVYRGQQPVYGKNVGVFLEWWTISGTTSGTIKNVSDVRVTKVKNNEACGYGGAR